MTEKSSNIQISFNKLSLWGGNPRTDHAAQDIAEMKASLKAKGLLQNLLVIPDENQAGNYLVIGGETRYRAIEELVADGHFNSDQAFSCLNHDLKADDPAVLEIALAENINRKDMHPLDEADAMANLFKTGRSLEAIALTFGYSSKTVRDRLAIGNLIDPVKALVRTGERDLYWAKAMTSADIETQNSIFRDIQGSPKSWAHGDDVLRHLSQGTIPARFALFDMSEYKSTIIPSMFEDDMLADINEFWRLQNIAIENKRKELLSEGWKNVEIIREHLDRLAYHPTESDNKDGYCFIEVMATGKVQTYLGLSKVEKSAAHQNDTNGALHEATNSMISHLGGLPGASVRPTAQITQYMAGERTAIIQKHIAQDFRLAMELAVVGMLGHSQANIRGKDYKFVGNAQELTGSSHDAVRATNDEIEETLLASGIAPTGYSDQEILDVVQAMSDEVLQGFFTKVVSRKVGQITTNKIDENEASLINQLGSQLSINVRDEWEPSPVFFDLMKTPDVRRIAYNLLPEDRRKGIVSAKKDLIIRTLMTAFEDAAQMNGSMSIEEARRLNEWTPGGLQFPAYDDTKYENQPKSDSEVFDEEESVDSILFAG